MTETPATIDEYIDTSPADVQVILHEVRRRIRNAVPDADETISYGIPTFTLGGTYLVYFAGWKHHVYPVPTGDADFDLEIEPYRVSKGTLKFPLADPLPYDLIERTAALLLRERVSADP